LVTFYEAYPLMAIPSLHKRKKHFAHLQFSACVVNPSDNSKKSKKDFVSLKNNPTNGKTFN